MPSDETRRVLKQLGIAVTTYEDAIRDGASRKEVARARDEVRARLDDLHTLLERLDADASGRER